MLDKNDFKVHFDNINIAFDYVSKKYLDFFIAKSDKSKITEWRYDQNWTETRHEAYLSVNLKEADQAGHNVKGILLILGDTEKDSILLIEFKMYYNVDANKYSNIEQINHLLKLNKEGYIVHSFLESISNMFKDQSMMNKKLH